MSWYDVFSNFYDASLERLYREYRLRAGEALQLAPGACVLDVPCGTGQSFDVLAAGVGDRGAVIGVDASPGMLRGARARCARLGLGNVQLIEADAGSLTRAAIAAAVGGERRLDRLQIFLGMSVFPDPERCFTQLWQLLAPGGLCVIVDVYAERLGLQGWLVNQLANADIRRKFWEPLERAGSEFSLVDLPYRKQHGGQIKLAQARKV
jgi:ubiquinone/menaquinone biosynthesis C-methylase UbiE